jgi:hypothetical protein
MMIYNIFILSNTRQILWIADVLNYSVPIFLEYFMNAVYVI